MINNSEFIASSIKARRREWSSAESRLDPTTQHMNAPQIGIVLLVLLRRRLLTNHTVDLFLNLDTFVAAVLVCLFRVIYGKSPATRENAGHNQSNGKVRYLWASEVLQTHRNPLNGIGGSGTMTTSQQQLR